MNENIKNNPGTGKARQGIFDALLSLLDEVPYEKINISAIAQKAGVARQSFYRNYKNKDEIITDFITGIFEGVRNTAVNTAGKIHPREAYDSLFRALKQNKAKLTKLVNSKLELLILEPLDKFNSFVIEKLSGENQDEYILQYKHGGTMSLIISWLRRDMTEPSENMAELIEALLFGNNMIPALNGSN